MMTGDRQVGHEEALTARKGVDPSEHSRDRGWFVDAEAGLMITADVAGILQRLITAIADHGLHSQIVKAPGMKQARAVACAGQHLRD